MSEVPLYLIPHVSITLEPLTASRLHWRAGPLRSFAAIQKQAGLFCRSFLRNGEVFAYVGRIQNSKGLKDQPFDNTPHGSRVSLPQILRVA